LASLGHPCKFQKVSRLGSVTARHSSSGRRPNFAALNRGRHLYSARRSSRWELAHISSFLKQFCLSQQVSAVVKVARYNLLSNHVWKYEHQVVSCVYKHSTGLFNRFYEFNLFDSCNPAFNSSRRVNIHPVVQPVSQPVEQQYCPFSFAPGSTKTRLLQPSLDTARTRVSNINPRYGQVAEASCCDMS